MWYVKSYFTSLRDAYMKRQVVVRHVHLYRNASQHGELISLSKVIIYMSYCRFYSSVFMDRASVFLPDREIFSGR